MIDYLYYWERAINTAKYRVDGFHNVIASDVDEYHFLCPEYGKILFDDIGLRQVPERPADKGGRHMLGG
jgi:hypothetical protein